MTTTTRPVRGTLVRATSGVTHITRRSYQSWPGTGWLVETACGKRWATTLLEQATDGSEPCAKCWEAL
ncbi:MAG: hypothetical protein ACXV5Q_00785 [Frankiaceae bacterium]